MASPLEVTKTATLTGHRDCVYTLERSGVENIFYSAGGDGEWKRQNSRGTKRRYLIALKRVAKVCVIFGKLSIVCHY